MERPGDVAHVASVDRPEVADDRLPGLQPVIPGLVVRLGAVGAERHDRGERPAARAVQVHPILHLGGELELGHARLQERRDLASHLGADLGRLSNALDLLGLLRHPSVSERDRRVDPLCLRKDLREPNVPVVRQLPVVEADGADALELLLDDRVGLVPVHDLHVHVGVGLRGLERGLGLERRADDIQLSIGVGDRERAFE